MAKKATKKAKKKASKKVSKKAVTKASKKAGARKKAGKASGKTSAKKTAKKSAAKRRTTHRSSGGKKLYAVRNGDGTFNDIQQYSKAHAADIRQTTPEEAASAAPADNNPENA